jgi:hypothetical protein
VTGLRCRGAAPFGRYTGGAATPGMAGRYTGGAALTGLRWTTDKTTPFVDPDDMRGWAGGLKGFEGIGVSSIPNVRGNEGSLHALIKDSSDSDKCEPSPSAARRRKGNEPRSTPGRGKRSQQKTTIVVDTVYYLIVDSN